MRKSVCRRAPRNQASGTKKNGPSARRPVSVDFQLALEVSNATSELYAGSGNIANDVHTCDVRNDGARRMPVRRCGNPVRRFSHMMASEEVTGVSVAQGMTSFGGGCDIVEIGINVERRCQRCRRPTIGAWTTWGYPIGDAGRRVSGRLQRRDVVGLAVLWPRLHTRHHRLCGFGFTVAFPLQNGSGCLDDGEHVDRALARLLMQRAGLGDYE